MRKIGLNLLILCAGTLVHASTVQYSVTDLGLFPGGSITTGIGLSTLGWVTGWGDTATNSAQAFIWRADMLTNIGPSASPIAFGTAINALGQVAGYAFASDFSTFNAFLYDGAIAHFIPTLGGLNNAALGVNDSGVVVGYSEDASLNTLAFRWSGGTPTSLGTLTGGTFSQATAINNAGQIVGFGDVSGAATHGFFYNGGPLIDIGVPSGFTSSQANGVGQFGAVVGEVLTDTLSAEAFLWTSSGGMTLLGTLGGDSDAFGVSATGVVVGSSNGAAFIYDSGHMTDLNTVLNATGAGWQLQQALAINDRGQIVGTGLFDGEQRAFVLNQLQNAAAPEPGTWLMCAGALAAMLLRRRGLR